MIDNQQIIMANPPAPVSNNEPIKLFSNPMDIVITELSHIQAKLENIETTMINVFLKNTYADLGSCLEHVKPFLRDHNIVLHQTIEFYQDKEIFVTSLIHTSGQWVRSFIPFSYLLEKTDPKIVDLELQNTEKTNTEKTNSKTAAKSQNPIKTMQNIGAALQMARRYGLSMALGLAQKDTDGETNKNIKPKKTFQNNKSNSLNYFEKLTNLCNANQIDPSFFVNYYKIDTSKIEVIQNVIDNFAAKKEHLELYTKLKNLCARDKVDIKAFVNHYSITRNSIIEIKECIEDFENKKLQFQTKLLGV